MAKSILGVHYITAIAGDPDPDLVFDTRLLGLRLVKITVNFDSSRCCVHRFPRRCLPYRER
jgi:hypothetical protein